MGDLLTTTAILCLVCLVYVYVGYPALCVIAGSLRRRVVRSAQGTPRITVLISAYNEAHCIEATVRNKLEQDYPQDLLDVIVVSDESDDGTDQVVGALVDEFPGRVTLIRQEPRAGKTSALNLASTRAAGEILVFSDANSLYGSGALLSLVEPFADPDVGYVTGRMVYRAPDGSLTGEGCSAYMAYENKLRVLATDCVPAVGVAGSTDAARPAHPVGSRPRHQPSSVLPAP